MKKKLLKVMSFCAGAALAAVGSNDATAQTAAQICEKEEGNVAIEACNRALRSDPRNLQLLFWRAATYANSGDIDRAISDFAEIVRINPNYGTAADHLRELRRQKNRQNFLQSAQNQQNAQSTTFASSGSTTGWGALLNEARLLKTERIRWQERCSPQTRQCAADLEKLNLREKSLYSKLPFPGSTECEILGVGNGTFECAASFGIIEVYTRSTECAGKIVQNFGNMRPLRACYAGELYAGDKVIVSGKVGGIDFVTDRRGSRHDGVLGLLVGGFFLNSHFGDYDFGAVNIKVK